MALGANKLSITRVPDLSNINVLVVGDVMLDRYLMGQVERISPEAPVPIVSVNQAENRAGGAANVALNVVALGAKCTLVSVVGDDEHSQELESMLKDEGVTVDFIRQKSYKTTLKQRIISRNQQLIRLDFEQYPEDDLLNTCLERYSKHLGNVDSVIFSDYGKGCLKFVKKMIALAKDAPVNVSVDPKGRDFSRYYGANIITPNLTEFEHIVGEIQSDEQLDSQANRLREELALDKLLITLSERGMKLFAKNNDSYYSPARSREVYDVSGAGDTVIACIGTLMVSEIKIEEMLEIANAAASVVVAKLGTAAAQVDEINQALKRFSEQS